MPKFIIANWKSFVAIASMVWSAFCFVYIMYGLPPRVGALEKWVKEYELEKLPPRVTNLEGDVKSLEKEIYTLKADLQENYRVTMNTYQLVKELRDSLVLESLRNGHQK